MKEDILSAIEVWQHKAYEKGYAAGYQDANEERDENAENSFLESYDDGYVAGVSDARLCPADADREVARLCGEDAARADVFDPFGEFDDIEYTFAEDYDGTYGF